MKVKAACVLLILTACARTIPADTPSAMVPLGSRAFADFRFRVAPPPSAHDVSECRQMARPKGWLVVAPAVGLYVAGAVRDAAEHARQASVFTECLTERGYAVERVDASTGPSPGSSDFGSGR